MFSGEAKSQIEIKLHRGSKPLKKILEEKFQCLGRLEEGLPTINVGWRLVINEIKMAYR